MKSEFPINPDMEMTKMEIIKSFVQEHETILSIHCGIGLMELSMDNEIIAIDEKNYHIKDAKENAKFLHKDNVEFICKNVDEAVIQQCKKHKFDVAVVRSESLSQAMKQSFILSKINEVIYVSDHPSSLAKDLEELKKYYRIETIMPFDTLPYTSKLETVVRLKRK